MCSDCDDRFAHAVQHFDDSLAIYRKDCEDGLVRDTPAKRVADLALVFLDMPDQEAARILGAWYAAVAMERLMALEMSGIPT